jgi:hypothetical protein
VWPVGNARRRGTRESERRNLKNNARRMAKIKTYKKKTKKKEERKKIRKGKEGTCCYRFRLYVYNGRIVQGDFRQQITQNFVVLLFLFFNCAIDTLHLKARPEKKWDKSINANVHLFFFCEISQILYIFILF